MTSTRLQAPAIFARCGFAIAIGFVTGSLFLIGCGHIMRGQSPELEAMEFDEEIDKTQYVGHVAGLAGMGYQKVDGICLVSQLDGTGSEPGANGQREYLVSEIKTHNIDNINKLLARDDNSMAMLMGMIPAGAKVGDHFDVLVKTDYKSETTSLKGGYVLQARMKPFVETRRSVKFGHNSALAKGRVVTDSVFKTGDAKARETSGVILGGGVVTKDRKTGLELREGSQTIKNATAISRAINDRFSTHVRGAPQGVANPTNDKSIEMLIPDEYRCNIGRYFHLVLNIGFNESPGQRVNRMERLERQLHNSNETSLAAIRLEAIGQDAIGVLKRGVRSDNFDVRFHSAQALAYMDDNAGIAVLEAAAADRPEFRWHALSALTALSDDLAEEALVRLFNCNSTEGRYGAFQALRKSDVESIHTEGEFVGREFMMFTVPTTARPMIHISKENTQEIVIFGGDQHFNDNFLYLENGLTVRGVGDKKIEIKQFLPGKAETEIICSTLVSDVIRHLVRLGADYGDIILMLKDARSNNMLEAQLAINAVPRLSNSYRAGMETNGKPTGESTGKIDASSSENEDFVTQSDSKPSPRTASRPPTDLPGTELPKSSDGSLELVPVSGKARVGDSKPGSKKTGGQKKGIFGRMNDLFKP